MISPLLSKQLEDMTVLRAELTDHANLLYVQRKRASKQFRLCMMGVTTNLMISTPMVYYLRAGEKRVWRMRNPVLCNYLARGVIGMQGCIFMLIAWNLTPYGPYKKITLTMEDLQRLDKAVWDISVWCHTVRSGNATTGGGVSEDGVEEGGTEAERRELLERIQSLLELK
eukprot:PhM_4_TR13254/c0_g3_i1/m.100898